MQFLNFFQQPGTSKRRLKISIKVDFVAKIFGGINFYAYFCAQIRNDYEKKSVD